MSESIYDFGATTINGEATTLEPFKGKVLLIVNTASKCGFTSQYKELEELYQELKDKNFTVLGFPCNQFGSQEPGSEKEIQEFCQLNYGVSFPMFSKIEVNGNHAHPLYEYLKGQAKGLMGSKSIKWNFTKFLVDQQGKVLKRFGPQDKPSKIREEILPLL